LIAALVVAACGRSVKDYTYGEWKALDEEQQWELYGELDGHDAMLLFGQTFRLFEEDTINPNVTIAELLDRGRVTLEEKRAEWAKQKAERTKEADGSPQ
jgi:hypothetical protein